MYWVLNNRDTGVLARPLTSGLLIVLLLACASESDTPQARVRAYLAAGEAAAEDRDLLQLKEMISTQYIDRDGRDRRALTQLMAGYFLRHRGVHLLTQVERIGFAADARAQVTLLAAMAATPIADTQALFSLHADLYRFELELAEEDGEWKLMRAEWQPAIRSDFR